MKDKVQRRLELAFAIMVLMIGLEFLLLSQTHFYGGLQPGIQIGTPCGINVGVELHDNSHLATYRNGC